MRYGLADWDEAVGALQTATELVIACHVNPDGDALGALFGASLAFGKVGKKIYPSWGSDPAEVPPQYSWLPGTDRLVQPGDVPEATAFLALDCGGGDRLGLLEPVARAAPVLINVDHHPGNDNFGTYNLVHTSASSTSELVMGLLEDVGVSMDTAIATCLYTGVVTDTGRFQYVNVSPETLRLAADLLAHGVPAPDIALRVFESAPFAYLKLVGHVLERAVLDKRVRLVYSWITARDLEETGVPIEETDKLIDVIRSTRDADVAAIFKEQPDGTYRASLRSKGPNVGAIARSQGGGGHDLAAGFTAANPEAGVAAIRAALAPATEGR